MDHVIGINLPTSFAGACKDFFGFKPGQGLLDFRDELKTLTPEDKEEIKAGLAKLGYTFKE